MMKALIRLVSALASLGLVLLGAITLVSYFYSGTRLSAQTAVNTASMDAFAYESVTVSNAVVTLTAATHTPTGAASARLAIITVEDQSLRYTYDGTVPDASAVGHQAKADTTIALAGINNIRRFKAIRVSGTDSKIKVTYLR